MLTYFESYIFLSPIVVDVLGLALMPELEIS